MNTDPAADRATAPAHSNRVLVILAAAWMVISLALGGAVTADSRESAASDTGASVTVSRP